MLESLFNKVADLEAPSKVFYYETCEIFKNTSFNRTPPVAASAGEGHWNGRTQWTYGDHDEPQSSKPQSLLILDLSRNTKTKFLTTPKKCRSTVISPIYEGFYLKIWRADKSVMKDKQFSVVNWWMSE